MYAFRITCWALIFIFRLRFPPGVSIATILDGLLKLMHYPVNFEIAPNMNKISEGRGKFFDLAQ